MSFFSKLLGALRGGPGGASPAAGAGTNAFWIYVRCNACGEPIRVRVSRTNDLSAEFDEGGDNPSGYVMHKEIVGQRCFRRIQVDMTFDAQRRVSDQQIRGGTFLSADEYDAAAAAQPQDEGTPAPPAPPA